VLEHGYLKLEIYIESKFYEECGANPIYCFSFGGICIVGIHGGEGTNVQVIWGKSIESKYIQGWRMIWMRHMGQCKRAL
jgi:hypothetical protein